MFFSRITQKKRKDKSLRAGSSLNPLKTTNNIPTLILGKTSVAASRSNHGSMSIEAAIVVPLFLFAMCNLIMLIDVIRLQSNLEAAMQQSGNEMAYHAYAYEKGLGDTGNLLVGLMSASRAKGKIVSYLGNDYLEHSMIKGGSSGIKVVNQNLLQRGDIIDLKVTYQITPLIPIMGMKDFTMASRYYGKAWTGYEIYNSGGYTDIEDPMVFITKSGTVYHFSRSCRYLNVTVRAVDAGSIKDYRNASGMKYTACEICGASSFLPVVYITDQGTKVHSDINCSGLKRTIYTIPLSQTGTRAPCSQCN